MIARDANVEPDVFANGQWLEYRTKILRVPVADVSACRSKGQDGTNRKVEVVEDHDTKPHKLVRFEVKYQKEAQEVRILKVPKPLLGVSG